MKIMTGVRISAVEPGSDGTTVHLTDKDGKEQQLVGDRVLMAVGRGPNTKILV